MTPVPAIPATPGEYRVTKEVYEADMFGPEPTLRSSTAWLLASKTPAHAFHVTPRLNPSYKREEKRHFDVGTIAHQLLLGQPGSFDVIDASNYKKKETQRERDSIYAVGRTPILEHELREIEVMVAAIRRQMAEMVAYGSLDAEPFRQNETERCIIWREDNGVMCRASLDGLSLDGDTLSEFKTEQESADPATWQWKARKYGYIFKLCFYVRGLSKLGICHSPAVRFFVAEKSAPHLLAMVRVDDELLAREHERVMAAIKSWGHCLNRTVWPGYALDGYDLGLTERERAAEHGPASGGGHLSSDDIAASL